LFKVAASRSAQITTEGNIVPAKKLVKCAWNGGDGKVEREALTGC
jgi:hypothetical protein